MNDANPSVGSLSPDELEEVSRHAVQRRLQFVDTPIFAELD